MADKLFARTLAVIAAGTPLTYAHGLSAAGAAVAPDILSPVPRGAKAAGVTANVLVLSSGSDATVIDLLAGTFTVDVMLQYLHSIQRVT